MSDKESKCDLPKGWRRKVVKRNNGEGREDVYYISPENKKFRSCVELRKHFGDSFDLTGFQYKTGRFKSGKKPSLKSPAKATEGRRVSKRKASPVKPLEVGKSKHAKVGKSKHAKVGKSKHAKVAAATMSPKAVKVAVAQPTGKKSSAKKSLFPTSPKKKIRRPSQVEFDKAGGPKQPKSSSLAVAAVKKTSSCQLPGKWLMKFSQRSKGARKGQFDVTYVNIETKEIFRSKKSLMNHFGSELDLANFVFATGVFTNTKKKEAESSKKGGDGSSEKEAADSSKKTDGSSEKEAADSSKKTDDSSKKEANDSFELSEWPSEEDSPNSAAAAANGDDEKLLEDGNRCATCDLPQGWVMKVYYRKTGNKVDVHYVDSGKNVFRSKKKLMAHFAKEKLGDLTTFNFRTGRFDKASSS